MSTSLASLDSLAVPAPGHRVSSAVLAVRSAGGIATSAELRSRGVTQHVLRRSVEGGLLCRLRRGYYALPCTPPSARLAVTVGGRLAGLSAAASYGLWGGWATPLHVCLRGNTSHVQGVRVPGDRGVRLVEGERLFVHWNDDRHDTRWCWRVSAIRCIRQVVRWHDRETALAVIDTALTQRALVPGDLAGLATGSTSVVTRDILTCRAGSGSGVESIVRQRLESVGLAVSQQVPVGGVGIVDFQVRGSRVLIEIDGFEFHSSPEKFADDRRRDAEAIARGFVPLRFTALQVRDRWGWVEQMITRAVVEAAL